jgi:hypothetical protein
MARRRWEPSQLVVACFSRHQAALDWAEGRLIESYGAIAARSPDYDFHHTDYYLQTMGPGLKKRLLVFAELRSASGLPGVKTFTIGLEACCARSGLYPEERPLNLDPGLLQLGKLVLASTKDQSHRIYLGQGIYAENTLRFHGKDFRPWPWTYADYREPEVRAFLSAARASLHRLILQLRAKPRSL